MAISEVIVIELWSDEYKSIFANVSGADPGGLVVLHSNSILDIEG